MSPDNEEGLVPGPPPISLSFQVPEFDRHEVYRVVLEDGTVVFRTREELEKAKATATPGEAK
mgnify:CR=1 FL=1